MILYPDIALREGRCVTLRRGQMSLPVVHEGDPVEIARRFVAEGAEWLNLVDLDAAGRRARDNTEILRAIIRAVDIPVQVGGGIARIEHVDWWIDQGADCVVIASAAVLNPALIHRAAGRHPYRVLVGLDVAQGRVMVDGWTRPTDHAPLDFIARFDRLDVAGVIVTDIDYDTALPDASFALVTDLARHIATPVIASGLVKTLDDLSTLHHLENIAGAIVGRALHEGRFTLRAALTQVLGGDPDALWWRRPEPRRPCTLPRRPATARGAQST